ncbi:MAG: carboxylating nicotinate-nucleotide diphosphorylase [Armatimonadota bacterium]|nr:carboxylating nicotinate-nucleotide diphosphorylase [bacterium]
MGLDAMYIESVVKAALLEDIGSGDITTLLTVPCDATAHATITAKESGVLAGQKLTGAVFQQFSGAVYEPAIPDGSRVEPGDLIGSVSGGARSILTGERTALNFLQQMSGVATLTAKYVDQVKHTKARIVDTRKTTPGLRRLEKYAVCVGGGYNHRFGLDDGILIKDNHIAASGGITAAIKAAKDRAPHTLKIEVEVTNIEQLDEAIRAGADIVMLDNMTLDEMRRAVIKAEGRVPLEASGGVNLDTVRQIAETGVDIISVGALTHSAPALDISLNIGASVDG